MTGPLINGEPAPVPGSRKERKVVSGSPSPPPSVYYDLASSCWRTYAPSLLDDRGSIVSSLTLPDSGSMRNGCVSEHRTSAPHTSGGGGSCWPGLPTPRARDSKGRGYSDGLPAVVELLPTPTVSETNGTGPADSPRNDTLRARVALLPTPRATRGGSSTETAALLPTPRATDGTKGGPNQRGTSGDLMLPSAVAQMSTGGDTGPPSIDGPASSGGQLLLPGFPPDDTEPTS